MQIAHKLELIGDTIDQEMENTNEPTSRWGIRWKQYRCHVYRLALELGGDEFLSQSLVERMVDDMLAEMSQSDDEV
jgi:hypothetical protein